MGCAPTTSTPAMSYLTRIIVVGWFHRNDLLGSIACAALLASVLQAASPVFMDARALARYLGRPVPAFHAIPISSLNFCSYDGVLRGPFGFRLSADELKHSSSVRSTA